MKTLLLIALLVLIASAPCLSYAYEESLNTLESCEVQSTCLDLPCTYDRAGNERCESDCKVHDFICNTFNRIRCSGIYDKDYKHYGVLVAKLCQKNFNLERQLRSKKR